MMKAYAAAATFGGRDSARDRTAGPAISSRKAAELTPAGLTGRPTACVQVLTPNPFSSGSARWNVMAAYGSKLAEGATPAQAQAYLTTLFHHVVSQDTSARNATQTFLAGKGDVLIAHENEAIADQRKGAPVD